MDDRVPAKTLRFSQLEDLLDQLKTDLRLAWTNKEISPTTEQKTQIKSISIPIAVYIVKTRLDIWIIEKLQEKNSDEARTELNNKLGTLTKDFEKGVTEELNFLGKNVLSFDEQSALNKLVLDAVNEITKKINTAIAALKPEQSGEPKGKEEEGEGSPSGAAVTAQDVIDAWQQRFDSLEKEINLEEPKNSAAWKQKLLELSIELEKLAGQKLTENPSVKKDVEKMPARNVLMWKINVLLKVINLNDDREKAVKVSDVGQLTPLKNRAIIAKTEMEDALDDFEKSPKERPKYIPFIKTWFDDKLDKLIDVDIAKLSPAPPVPPSDQPSSPSSSSLSRASQAELAEHGNPALANVHSLYIEYKKLSDEDFGSILHMSRKVDLMVLKEKVEVIQARLQEIKVKEGVNNDQALNNLLAKALALKTTLQALIDYEQSGVKEFWKTQRAPYAIANIERLRDADFKSQDGDVSYFNDLIKDLQDKIDLDKPKPK